MPKVVSIIPQMAGRLRAAHIELARRAADSHVSVSRQLAPVSADGSHGNPLGFLRDSIHVEGAAVDSNTAQLRDVQSGRFVQATGAASDVERKVVVGAWYGIYPE